MSNPLTKTYRAELKQIVQQRNRITAETAAFRMAMCRDVHDDSKRLAQYIREHKALDKAVRKDIARSERDCRRQLTRIDKRIAILKGRISS